MMRSLSWIGRQVIPALVGLAILTQALNRDLVAAAFYLNQRYIAENLCENTARPEMHCNGICQLKKSLQKAAEKEKQTAASMIKFEVQICDHWSEIRLPALFSSATAIPNPTNHLFSPSHIPSDIFRPPMGC